MNNTITTDRAAYSTNQEKVDQLILKREEKTLTLQDSIDLIELKGGCANCNISTISIGGGSQLTVFDWAGIDPFEYFFEVSDNETTFVKVNNPHLL